jgi:hypothetical protein
MRLDSLDPEDMSCALRFLIEYSPATFDTLLDVIGSKRPGGDDEANEEPFCASCGAPVGMFAADGLGYRHYREVPNGEAERYDAGHPVVIGWRGLTGTTTAPRDV